MVARVYKYTYKNSKVDFVFTRERNYVLVSVNDVTNPGTATTCLWDVPELHYSRTVSDYIANYLKQFESRVDNADFIFVLQVKGNGIWCKGD